jgi:hypothetical protein
MLFYYPVRYKVYALSLYRKIKEHKPYTLKDNKRA